MTDAKIMKARCAVAFPEPSSLEKTRPAVSVDARGPRRDTQQRSAADTRNRRVTAAKYLTAAITIATAFLSAIATAAGPASASPVHRMTLLAILHTCDFQAVEHATGRTGAIPLAEITSDRHTTTARIHMISGTPSVQYVVRLIPSPHPVLGCLAGDPSIATGTLSTDDCGVGSATLQARIAPGATGAWLAVDLPSAYSQTPQEFYSSNYIATI